MEGRVDFTLERSRLRASNLPPSAVAAAGGGLGALPSFASSELARAAADLTSQATSHTPASMSMTSLAQYQSRFLPSTMSMHSPGASFALMGGFLGGTTAADSLKSLVPDVQQFWAPHADAYPRFVINSGPFAQFGPFLPSAPPDPMPSLLPPQPPAAAAPLVPAHCHRIYELQKDALLTSFAASQAAANLYGFVPGGHPFFQRAASPLHQPQLAALTLANVKQEPRELSNSCQGYGERSGSRSAERRPHVGSGAVRAASECSGNRKQPGKDVYGPASSQHPNNNNNSSQINNNNNNSCANNNNKVSSSGRTHSGHRSTSSQRAPGVHGKPGSERQQLAVKASDPPLAASQSGAVPPGDNGRDAKHRASICSEPMVDKPRAEAAASSELVNHGDSALIPLPGGKAGSVVLVAAASAAAAKADSQGPGKGKFVSKDSPDKDSSSSSSSKGDAALSGLSATADGVSGAAKPAADAAVVEPSVIVPCALPVAAAAPSAAPPVNISSPASDEKKDGEEDGENAGVESQGGLRTGVEGQGGLRGTGVGGGLDSSVGALALTAPGTPVTTQLHVDVNMSGTPGPSSGSSSSSFSSTTSSSSSSSASSSFTSAASSPASSPRVKPESARHKTLPKDASLGKEPTGDIPSTAASTPTAAATAPSSQGLLLSPLGGGEVRSSKHPSLFSPKGGHGSKAPSKSRDPEQPKTSGAVKAHESSRAPVPSKGPDSSAAASVSTTAPAPPPLAPVSTPGRVAAAAPTTQGFAAQGGPSRSQLLLTTAPVTAPASPAQPKGTVCSSGGGLLVTSQVVGASQVVTSALPYYHTLYSQSDGGQEGSGGAKKVQATTTYVPEVGTFRGPLVRSGNVPKGSPAAGPEVRGLKTEQVSPRGSCRGDGSAFSGSSDSDGSVPHSASNVAGGGGVGDKAQREESVPGGRTTLYSPSSGTSSSSTSTHQPGVRGTETPGSRRSPSLSVPFMLPTVTAGRTPGALGFLENSEEALDFSLSRRSKEVSDASSKTVEDHRTLAPRRAGDAASGKDTKRAGSSVATPSSSSSRGRPPCPGTVCLGPSVVSAQARTELAKDVAGVVVSGGAGGGLGGVASQQVPATLTMAQLSFLSHALPRPPALFPPPAPPGEQGPSALNLCKQAPKKKLATDSAGAVGRTLTKKKLALPAGGESRAPCGRARRLVDKEKTRCGSAPPHSSFADSPGRHQGLLGRPLRGDSEEEGERKSVESVEKETPSIAASIPVGIAVAQQRAAEAVRVATRFHADPSRLQNSDREDVLRQQKTLLTGTRPVAGTALPPNLVVTGGENTLSEDIRLRPLPSQWMTASSWLHGNPFASLHPAIPTSTAALDPTGLHPPVPLPTGALPGGFKLAQDPLTGQLLIIPGGDLLEQGALWPTFQTSASAQPLHPPPAVYPALPLPLSQHAAATSASGLTSGGEGRDRSQAEEKPERPRESGAVVHGTTPSGRRSPDDLSKQQATFSQDKPAAVANTKSGLGDSREREDGAHLNAAAFVAGDLTSHPLAALQAAVAAAGISPQQMPFLFNPSLLSMVPGLAAVGEALGVKTETAHTQSRGCSPIVFSESDEEEEKGKLEEEGKKVRSQRRVTTSCASVQTGSDLDLARRGDRDAPAGRTPPRKPTTSCKELGVQASLGEPLQPLSVVICGSGDLPLKGPGVPLGALAEAALAAEGKATRRGVEVKAGAHGPGGGGMSYNPFTDPQILQAADGLELLSTLAEKRPKCSSAPLVDPKAVFPSPSDSFKSDTPLPCPELEESLGEGERSGGTTPRGDREGVSPKSARLASRRDAEWRGTLGSGGEFKSSRFADMDAMEMDMRIRLAELQRQYREKQRELAKLQPKKLQEGGGELKRGRGRPRKRQLGTSKKYDDESGSSNSSGSKAHKEGAPPKKKRPAEELVDRVFRKLPPAKLGGHQPKPMSLKHKRRHHFPHTDGTKESNKKKDKHRHDAGNLFSNLESSFRQSPTSASGKKRPHPSSPSSTSGIAITGSGLLHPHLHPCTTVITPVSLESGLGLLAKFATSALTSTSLSTTSSASSMTSPFYGTGAVRRRDDGEHGTPWDGIAVRGEGGLHHPYSHHTFGSSPGGSPISKRRGSDTDTSDPSNGPSIKKRKPGRPRKCDPNKNTGLTETIWARQTGLLQLSDVAQGKSWVSKAEEAAITTSNTSATVTSPGTSSTSSTSPTSTFTSVKPSTALCSSLSSSSSSTITTSTTAATPTAAAAATTTTTTTAVSATTAATTLTTPTSSSSSNPDPSAGSNSGSSSSSGGGGGGQGGLPPLLLDEWSLRRSERIFLSDTSPQPSPSLHHHHHQYHHQPQQQQQQQTQHPPHQPPPHHGSSATAGGSSSSKASTSSACSLKHSLPPSAASLLGSRAASLSAAAPVARPKPKGSGGGRGRPPGTGYKQRQRQQQQQEEEQQRLVKLQKLQQHSQPKPRASEGGGLPSTAAAAAAAAANANAKPAQRSRSHSPARGLKDGQKVKVRDGEKVRVKDGDKGQGKDSRSAATSHAAGDAPAATTGSKGKVKAAATGSGPLEDGKQMERKKEPGEEDKEGKKRREKKKRQVEQAKAQKARSLQALSLQALSQKVKRKYNKSLQTGSSSKSSATQHHAGKAKPSGKGRTKATPAKGERSGRKVEEKCDPESDSYSEGDNVPLSTLRERTTTPEPRSCVIGQEELADGMQVLFFKDSLFYEGLVQAVKPPDIYGVVITGQRGTRPHICSREEILNDAIMAVAPGSKRYVSEGTRVCAYWSQQFRCLYPGTVAKTSPNPHAESSVNVEFDDGDSGRIPISHIRLLPHDFPLVTEPPNPVLHPTKRRRRTLSEEGTARSRSLDDASSSHNNNNNNSSHNNNNCSHNNNSSSSSNARRQSRHVSAMLAASNKDAQDLSDDDNDSSILEVASVKSNGSGGSRSAGRSRDAANPTAPAPSGKVRREAISGGSSRAREGPQPLPRPTATKSTPSKKRRPGEDKEWRASDDSANESESDSSQDGGLSSSSSSEDDGKGKRASRGPCARKRTDDDPAGSGEGWEWAGPSTKRPGMRGKAKKEFYKAISRGAERISVGDCAVFLSVGRDLCPYVGRVESLWESWGGQMMVKVRWFYHPQETKGCKQLAHAKGALFESPHSDENDIQTISHKCQVVSLKEYKKRAAELGKKGQGLDSDTYYLAGYYDPMAGLVRLQPDVQ